jgi:hypothetical protein
MGKFGRLALENGATEPRTQTVELESCNYDAALCHRWRSNAPQPMRLRLWRIPDDGAIK